MNKSSKIINDIRKKASDLELELVRLKEERENNILFKKIKPFKYPGQSERGANLYIEKYKNGYYGVDYEKLEKDFDNFEKLIIEDIESFKVECDSVETPLRELEKALNKALSHLGINVSKDMLSIYGINPSRSFESLNSKLLDGYKNRINAEKIKRDEELEEKIKKEKLEYFKMKQELILKGESLDFLLRENVFEEYEKQSDQHQSKKDFIGYLEESLYKVMSGCKYLSLAHTMEEARGDFSCVEDAKDAIRSFLIENDYDKMLYSALIEIAESDETDGRVFRDTKYSYSEVFSHAKDNDSARYSKYRSIKSLLLGLNRY